MINTTSAENQAKKIQARVQLGDDPQEERKELRDRPRLTVRALCRQFFDEVHKDPNFSPKTERGYRNIEKNHLGALGDLMFDELCSRQNEIVTHVRKVNAEVSAHTASALRTMLGSTYKWAMTIYPDNIPRNPVTGTWVPDYKTQKQGQALTMEQLGAIWRACEIMEREAVPTYRGNALGGGLTESVRAKTAFVSSTEAAKIAGMGRRSLLNMMHAGRIKAIVRTPKKTDSFTTAPAGERGGRKLKMTPQQRQEALQRLHAGETKADLARSYGVDPSTITNLVRELLPGRTSRRPYYLFAAEDLKQFTDHRLSAMRSVDLEYSVILRLMILFGSRYGEMAKLAWSEINLEKGVLHIPTLYPDGSRRLKSNRGASRDLTIYMPQLAIDLIKKIPRRPDRDYLFGIGPHGLTENDIQKKALDAIILKNEGAPITYVHPSNGGDGNPREDHWTLHWLRHSFSTRVDEDLGVDLRIIRAITNHLSRKQKERMWGGENEPGQHKRYTHSKYPVQQRQALTAWAQAVLDAAHRVERKGDEKVVWDAFGKTAS